MTITREDFNTMSRYYFFLHTEKYLRYLAKENMHAIAKEIGRSVVTVSQKRKCNQIFDQVDSERTLKNAAKNA